MKLNEIELMAQNIMVATPDKSIWAIGDVHGCADEFREMCVAIKNIDSNAVIFQLGDLIDRGPYVYEVFEVIRDYGVIPLIGNHELNFLLEHYKKKRCSSKARADTHEIFNSLSDDKQELILSTIHKSKNYYKVKTTNPNLCYNMFNAVYLAHAPMPTGHVWPNSAWTYCTNGSVAMSTEFNRDMLNVYGHQYWNYHEIEEQVADIIKGNAVNSLNIDGGCVYGNELIGLNIVTLETIAVKSKEQYVVHIKH